MDMPDIDPFVQHGVDTSFKTMASFVRKGEHVVSQVILFARDSRDGRPAMIPLVGWQDMFPDGVDVDRLRSVVKKAWGNMKADKPWLGLTGVVMMSDAYAKDISDEEFEKVRGTGTGPNFSEKSGVFEALFVQLSLVDREVHYHWPYVRGEGEVVFRDRRTRVMSAVAASDGSLLGGLWPF